MTISRLAGKPPPTEMLIDPAPSSANISSVGPISTIRKSSSALEPAGIAARRSACRSPKPTLFAISQAICDYRDAPGTDGPLYMGKDPT
jgi:phosphoglucomutase